MYGSKMIIKMQGNYNKFLQECEKHKAIKISSNGIREKWESIEATLIFRR
jgi:hypothetical protein